MRHRILTLVAAGLLASVASCGGSEQEAASTGTVAPTTTAATASGPFPAGEPVDLVLLADSGGGGVAEPYAAKAAEALDREIRVHDFTRMGARADDILWGIQSPGEGSLEVGGSWAQAVADAEIIVFHVHPGGFEPRRFVPCLEATGWEDSETDATPPPTWDPPAATSIEDWQGYRDALDQVYDEIWKLRAGQPTIVRAYGTWLPWLGQWQQLGIDRACVAGEEAVDQARQESAEAHGAIFVSMMDVFSGSEHDEDPIEKGWIAEDGMHLNEAGHVVLVDALARAGFEPSEPPS